MLSCLPHPPKSDIRVEGGRRRIEGSRAQQPQAPANFGGSFQSRGWQRLQAVCTIDACNLHLPRASPPILNSRPAQAAPHLLLDFCFRLAFYRPAPPVAAAHAVCARSSMQRPANSGRPCLSFFHVSTDLPLFNFPPSQTTKNEKKMLSDSTCFRCPLSPDSFACL